MKKILMALTMSALFASTTAGAVGVLVPSAGRVDMVHDAARGMIYITDGGNVLRYNIASASFLSPIALGGQLSGLDLSPDGNTLAVASRTSDTTTEWVNLVRLTDLTVTRASTTKDFMEDGFWSVAYGADGTLLATARFAGSGWVPLRRLDPVTMSWTRLGGAYPNNTFTQDGMVSASGNGKVIAMAESNISDGRWDTFKIDTAQLTKRSGYTDGTSWFNYDIASNVDGSQFAIPTYGGTFIYDGNYARIATIGTYAGAQPVGVAYHPVEPLIYFPWTTTREVRVYSAASLGQVGSYDFEDTFNSSGNHAFVQGRTRLSRDGSLLMVSVTGGVRFLQMYAPLSAAPVTGSVLAGATVQMGLKGAIGNGGQLSYALASAPAHGSASISGNLVSYTPAAGYVGADSFNYVARYGNATVQSSVAVTVMQPNRAPVAKLDFADVVRNGAVLIPVLANDFDADGDVLNITTVSQPLNGSTAIQFGKVLFTPARNFFGTTSFSYTISDGKGGTATGQVSVSVNKK